jgi:hypothetical protein
MAELIEVQEDQGSLDAFNQPAPEATTEQVTTAPAEPVEANIPDKYKGKSLEEIVKMHQEAEKLIGRQAQEVGEVRKLADDLIKQQLNTTKQDTQPSVEDNEIDYFADPNKAVNQAVENNPVVRELKEQAELAKRQNVVATLQQQYPNYMEIVQTDDFKNWIKASRVRTNLLIEAENFNLDAAQELLGTYTELKGVKAQQAQKADDVLVDDAKATRSQALKTAAIQKGGSGEVGKPTYKRVDLIRLRMTDPNRYNDMHDEIMQAYAEGRVK